MSDKINICQIFFEHHRTFYNNKSGRFSVADYLVFYLVPIAIGYSAWKFGIILDKDQSNGGIAAASIFAGLLINVLVLLYSVAQKCDKPNEKKLLKETFANVAYAIVLSLISVAALLGNLLITGGSSMVSAFSVGIFLQFVLALIMSIKRLHSLIYKEL